ncbi:glycosyltransferase family 2 protein [Meridianimaribacter flavus]
MSKPKVTVCCITYNHEKYIAECLDGFLLQQTNFDVEFLIHDDASTDGTQNVILSKVGNDSRFQLILRKENIKSTGVPVFPILYKQAKGDYIALCEGDDYWTDPLKLQKQVDFLEANNDYVICFHKVKILKSNAQIVDDFITKVPEHYETIETLAKYGNYIHTPSVVFKNIIKEYPVEFNEVPFGDYFLYMLLAQHGYIKCLNEAMSVYRVGVGVISKMTGLDIANNNVKLYSCMVSVLDDHKLKKIIYKKQLDVVTSHYLEIEEKLKLMEEKYNSLKLVQSNYFVSNHTFFRLLKKMITKCKTFKRKLHQLIKLR